VVDEKIEGRGEKIECFLMPDIGFQIPDNREPATGIRYLISSSCLP